MGDRLTRHLIAHPRPGNYTRIRGHGVEGYYAEVGRWTGDPSPCLYLTRLGRWNRMATVRCVPVPTTGAGWRRLLREIRGMR